MFFFRKIEQIQRSIENNSFKYTIRLNEQDLNVLVYESTKLVKKVYERCIFQYENIKSASDFFEQNGITDNDWSSIT